MDKPYESTYNATYTSFSGADIVATFNNHVIGELQAISYSVTREKAPIYVMGSPDPRSFSRGKRGIAGSLVFTVFNKDTMSELKASENSKFYSAFANREFRENLGMVPDNDNDISVDNREGLSEQWEKIQQMADQDNPFTTMQPQYADEIPPFDVTITMCNEYGQSAKFSIIGVEILNEGSGMSIDDITTEKACTFVARALTPLTSMNETIGRPRGGK